jgi:hypothetical protein
VHKAKASTLKREFDSFLFNDGKTVDDSGAHIGRITNELAVLGFEYTEEEVVRWFLLAPQPKFEQIVASIKTLLDLETTSVDELISRLKPLGEHINHYGGNSIASLNLTEDELMACLSSQLKVSGNDTNDGSKKPSSSNNKRGCDRGRGHGSGGHGGNCSDGNTGSRSGENTGGHDGGNTSRGGGGTSGNITSDECRYCGKHGH